MSDRDTIDQEEPAEEARQEPAAQHQPAEGEEPGREEQLGHDEADPVRRHRQQGQRVELGPVRASTSAAPPPCARTASRGR